MEETAASKATGAFVATHSIMRHKPHGVNSAILVVSHRGVWSHLGGNGFNTSVANKKCSKWLITIECDVLMG